MASQFSRLPVQVESTQAIRHRAGGAKEIATKGTLEMTRELADVLRTLSPESAAEVFASFVNVGPTSLREGYLREHSSYTLSLDGMKLEFTFVDVEQLPPSGEEVKPIIVE